MLHLIWLGNSLICCHKYEVWVRIENFQGIPVCRPEGRECYQRKVLKQDFASCSASCSGLYADVSCNATEANVDKLKMLQEEYDNYKRSFAENLVFDQNTKVANLSFAPLQVVQIYFDTATYDKIEKDEKVTLEAQLGVIGGTMGLLTGFSILSGVEIIYFALKLFMSIIENKQIV